MTKKFKIAIIDYDMGNIRSIENAINHVGEYDIVVTNDASEVESADCILLPGVGAFPDAMRKLKETGLLPTLNKVVKENKKPTLGICLGMQLLFDSSEELTKTDGLGFIPGKVVYMKPGSEFRVPHIGWNSLILQKEQSVFDYLTHDKDFYFVHSLYAQCDEQYILAKFDYGSNMTAAVQYDNVIGMQFHPEKSQKIGLGAMSSFLCWAQDYVSDRDYK
jgi:glutamine amidotransferase